MDRLERKARRDRGGDRGEVMKEPDGVAAMLRRRARIAVDDDTQHTHMPDYRFPIEGDSILVRRKDVVVEIEGRTEPGCTLRLVPETMAAARNPASG